MSFLSKQGKSKNMMWIVILIVLVGGFFFFKSKGILFTTIIGPGEYAEWQCWDVSDYQSNAAKYGFDSCTPSGTYTDKNLNCPLLTCSKSVLTVQGYCAGAYGHCPCCGPSPSCGYWFPGPLPTPPNDAPANYVCNVYGTSTYTIGGAIETIKSCQVQSGDVIAVESFYGGKTINKLSTRFPVKSFCNALPAIITDASTNTVQTSTVIYSELLNGSDIFIPKNETLTLFYVMQYYSGIKTVCSNGEALSMNTCITHNDGTIECSCVPSLGIIQVCSDGIYDPALGLCVVQPEAGDACQVNGAPGGRLQQTLNGSWYCVWNPPQQANCTPYGNNAYYSLDLGKCIYTPTVIYNCTTGIYNNISKLCIINPQTQSSCPTNTLSSGGYCYAWVATSLNQSCPSGTAKIDNIVISGITYNCKGLPGTEYQCLDGFGREYINNVVKCTKSPDIYYDCKNGTYDSLTGTCKIPVTQIQYNCPGVMSADKTTCIMEPATTIYDCSKVSSQALAKQINGTWKCVVSISDVNYTCPQNATYDSSKGWCILEPQAVNICFSPYNYSTSMNKCIYVPPEEILCERGQLDRVNGVCIYNPSVQINCPITTTYDSTIGKCVMTPDVQINDWWEKNKKNVYIFGGLLIGLVVLMRLFR